MKAMLLREKAMRMLRRRCSRLRELHLEKWQSVNNDTIKIIITKGNDGQCVLNYIKVLDVGGMNISNAGLQHILECISSISHLYHHKVIPAALQLLQRGSLTAPLHLECFEISGLRGLFSSVEHISNTSFDLSAFVNVTSVVIVLGISQKLSNQKSSTQLEVFANWKSGQTQKKTFIYWTPPPREVINPNIGRYPTRSVLFSPWVSTLIQITGGNLYELWLEDVLYISFTTIGKTCQNLRCLCVHFWCVQSDAHPTALQRYFENIEILCLLREVFSNTMLPSIEQIIIGLIAPMHKFKALELSDIKMNDTFLFNLLSSNPPSVIEVIVLAACGIHMMNYDIVSFIGQCAKLRKLSINFASLYADSYSSDMSGLDPELTKELSDRGWDVERLLSMDVPPGPEYVYVWGSGLGALLGGRLTYRKK